MVKHLFSVRFVIGRFNDNIWWRYRCALLNAEFILSCYETYRMSEISVKMYKVDMTELSRDLGCYLLFRGITRALHIGEIDEYIFNKTQKLLDAMYTINKGMQHSFESSELNFEAAASIAKDLDNELKKIKESGEYTNDELEALDIIFGWAVERSEQSK